MSHISPKSTDYATFGALMALTALTVYVAYLHLGWLNFPVAITIALTKASLVVLFFMHVKYSSKLTKLLVASTFFFLASLFGLTMTDYLSRGWHTSPRGTTTAGMMPKLSAAALAELPPRPSRRSPTRSRSSRPRAAAATASPPRRRPRWPRFTTSTPTTRPKWWSGPRRP